MKKALNFLLVLMVMTILLLAACSDKDESAGSNSDSTTEGNINKDAVLNIAYPTNLQTLDPHLTTNQSTRDVSRQIFEQLLTLNENYEVVPSLAESYEVSEDGLTYTFHLREGVKFHNGEGLQADDVVASMEKWMLTSTQGKANLAGAKFVEVDPLTVELHIEKASLIVPFVLADTAPFPAIVPKESVESASESGLTEYIGTGPFKLEEWKVDQHIHLTRFDEYASREEDASGLGGKKEALVKDVYFKIVADESTRVSGVTTGEYDIAFEVPFDSVAQLEATDGVEPVYSDGGTSTYVFNKKSGPFSDVNLRQAFNAALNVEDALIAAYSDEQFFEIDSSLSLPSQVNWYSEAGKEYYNQNDIEKAKQLVEESSYNGEELVILTTKDYPAQYNLAVVAQQVLESIGVKSKLDVYDWPTLQERRTDPNNFDVFPMTFAVRPTIHQNPFLASRAEYAGWTNSPEIDQLLTDITSSKSFEEAKPLIDELQLEVWEYLPILKVGNNKDLVAVSTKVVGYNNLIGPILWNVSKSE
ncbi:ABC transporter substrate-binding protein [Psychrobacillus sp. BM2]|uniref:ABC transporter substrate-binding protein n=1 Tax=Psychrobacillus sp. BM2 TaxID=3400421 RepID=UPI003B0190B1